MGYYICIFVFNVYFDDIFWIMYIWLSGRLSIRLKVDVSKGRYIMEFF